MNSREGPQGISQDRFPETDIPAGRALEVVKDLIGDDDGRRAYKASPREAFDDRKGSMRRAPSLPNADYGDIPANSRTALENLSLQEMELLSTLDATFVDDNLFVEVPSPGRLMHF